MSAGRAAAKLESRTRHKKPSTCTRAPPQSRLDLPQELEDVIFDMCYPAEDLSRYISKEAWDEREMEAMRDSSSEYSARPFPSPKVDEFLVSRGFCNAASRAWARNQPFGDNLLDPDFTLKLLQYRFFNSGLHKSFLVDLCVNLRIKLDATYTKIHTLPGLKALSMRVSNTVFETLEPRFAWKVVLTPEELARVMRLFHLDKLSGLVKLSILPSDFSYAKTPAQKQQFAENVQALEDVVKPIATKPKEAVSAGSTSQCKPLHAVEPARSPFAQPVGDCVLSAPSPVSNAMPRLPLSDQKDLPGFSSGPQEDQTRLYSPAIKSPWVSIFGAPLPHRSVETRSAPLPAPIAALKQDNFDKKSKAETKSFNSAKVLASDPNQHSKLLDPTTVSEDALSELINEFSARLAKGSRSPSTQSTPLLEECGAFAAFVWKARDSLTVSEAK